MTWQVDFRQQKECNLTVLYTMHDTGGFDVKRDKRGDSALIQYCYMLLT